MFQVDNKTGHRGMCVPAQHLRASQCGPGYLWPVGFPGVGSVQLSEDTLVLGLQGLLSVDMIYLGLPTPEDQNHGARIHSWGPGRPITQMALMPKWAVFRLQELECWDHRPCHAEESSNTWGRGLSTQVPPYVCIYTHRQARPVGNRAFPRYSLDVPCLVSLHSYAQTP